ncbi:MAG: hypothetical protein H7Y33_09015 [Cytophagales bacterium]|nr:hypothetical protein [Rhizobacter sp.]
MSTTLSHLSTAMPAASWQAPPIERNAPASNTPFAPSQVERGRIFAVSPGVEPEGSSDVDAWAAAVVSPLLEDATV